MKHFILPFLISVLIITSCKKTKEVEEETPDPIPEVPAKTVLPIYYGSDTLGSWQIIYAAEKTQPFDGKQEAKFTMVQFPTKDIGYVLDGYWDNIGRYKLSLDGGKNWSGFKPMPTEANRMHFITPNVGFAYRNRRSNAAGLVPLWQVNPIKETEWAQIFKSDRTYTTIRNMVFPVDTIAYAISEIGEFIKIKDPLKYGGDFNGAHATNLGIVSTYDVIDFHFPDVKNGWMVSYATMDNSGIRQGAAVFHTTDGGLTWTKQFEDTKISVSSIMSIDANNAWISSGDGFYRTTDGGKNWLFKSIVKADGSAFTPEKMLFLTGQRGFVVSTNEVLETTDGGLTWKRSLKDGETGIIDIYLTKPNILWAISHRRLFKMQL